MTGVWNIIFLLVDKFSPWHLICGRFCKDCLSVPKPGHDVKVGKFSNHLITESLNMGCGSELRCIYILTELQKRCIKLSSITTACIISSSNRMFDHLLESFRWDDSNKLSNIGFGEEISFIEINIHTLSGTL